MQNLQYTTGETQMRIWGVEKFMTAPPPLFIFEGEITGFEAMATTLDRAQADSVITDDLRKLVM
jgi:hypothetical protein